MGMVGPEALATAPQASQVGTGGTIDIQWSGMLTRPPQRLQRPTVLDCGWLMIALLRFAPWRNYGIGKFDDLGIVRKVALLAVFETDTFEVFATMHEVLMAWFFTEDRRTRFHVVVSLVQEHFTLRDGAKGVKGLLSRFDEHLCFSFLPIRTDGTVSQRVNLEPQAA